MKTIALITAAGQGKRMGQPKQFLDLGGQPLLQCTAQVFDGCSAIDGIIVVVNQEDIERVKSFGLKKLAAVVAGGQERQDSVFNGLQALPSGAEIVAIHDGARPFITAAIIERAVAEAKKSGAVVVGVPVKDTIKMSNDQFPMSSEGMTILRTLGRDRLWQAQTPQVFKKDILLKAYQAKDSHTVTDDAMLVEKLGQPVAMVLGSYENIKITTPEDLIMAEGILRKIKEGEGR